MALNESEVERQCDEHGYYDQNGRNLTFTSFLRPTEFNVGSNAYVLEISLFGPKRAGGIISGHFSSNIVP